MHIVLRPRTTHTSPTTGCHLQSKSGCVLSWPSVESGKLAPLRPTTYLRRPCSSNTSTISASASDLRLGLAADSSRMCCTNLGRLQWMRSRSMA
jgi:hypothetical protein